MKQLRILTGHHAGTQLKLAPGRYTISALDTADIQLIDWNAEPVILTLSEDNVATIAFETMSDTAELAGSARRMSDLVAQSFADVVLCLGPLDALWPRDMSLLAGLMLPQMPQPGPGTPGRKLLLPLLLAAAMCVGGSMVVLLSGGAVAAPEQTLSPNMSVAALEAQVEGVLTTFPNSMLVVLRQDQNVVVRGLLNTADAAMQLRERLAIFPRGRVQSAFSSAPEPEPPARHGSTDPARPRAPGHCAEDRSHRPAHSR
jgi:type III secretion protein D